jgi:magnesium-transporting ATPase (P-type)
MNGSGNPGNCKKVNKDLCDSKHKILTGSRGMLSLSRENEPSYYRRRRIEEQPIRTRTQRRQPSRFTRLKNVTLNWLNGLPPTDYDSALDEFQSERVEAEESFPEDLQKLGTDRSGSDAVNDDGDLDNPVSRKRKGLRKKLARLRSLLALSKKNAGESEMETNRADQFNAVAIPPENDFQDEKLLLQSPDTKIRVQQLEETGFVETRPSIREIVLPPDYLGQRNFLRYAAQLRPKLRRKFLEAHPWTISNQIRTAKYTVLTFLPKNLFEQFRRAANVYFLLLIVLQAIPIFSNTNPFLAASPLVCILALTAIKDAIEDWKRQKSDVVVNHAITWVLKRGDVESMANDTTIKSFGEMLKSVCTTGYQAVLRVFTPRVKIPKIPGTPAGQSGRNYWRQTYWKDVRVGDIILIKNNEMIPADVVVLSTSDQQGICYVETKNLDGETNLKIRQAPSKTSWIQTPDQAASFSALVQVEPPSTRLYTFAGKLLVNMEDARGDSRSANDQFIEMSTDALPINHEGLLLRGCQIRNTEHVIGVVAYTGIHTKIIMNSGMTPSKRSRIERQMNPQVSLNYEKYVVTLWRFRLS